MSKVGFSILAVILSTAVVITFFLIVSSQRSLTKMTDEILQDEAQSFVKIMKGDISELDTETQKLLNSISLDTAISFALTTSNANSAEAIFNKHSMDESAFAAFFGADGSLIYSSDKFPKEVTLETAHNGLNSDSESMFYCCSKEIEGQGSIIVGYDMRSYNHLDAVREKTGGHFTIFKDNIRYATTILDENGNRLEGSEMSDEIADKVLNKGQTYIGQTKINGSNYVVCYEPITDYSGKTVGAYFGGYETHVVDSLLNKKVMVMVFVGIGLTVVITAVAVIICNKLIKRKILTPVERIGEMTKEMNKGNLGFEISDVKREKDEVGELLSQVETMKNTLHGYISDLSRVLGSIANGDFTKHTEEVYSGDFIELNQSAELISEQMRNIISKINETSDKVNTDASASAKSSDILASGTIRQAAAIEQLSASLNEITAKVTETAEKSHGAMELANNGSEVLEEQHNYMGQMTTAMEKISAQSAEIERINKTIDDIAFQTNILALNAAIEAARAGEAGKGFAVVADEVRNLAAKSAEAVQSTSTLIAAAVSAVSEGSEIAQKNAESLNSVVEIFDRTKKMIDDISSAAEYESQSIEQVSNGITEISNVVQQTSAAAQEIAASCQELNGQAVELHDEVKMFVI